MPFRGDAEVVVKQIDDENWEVMKALEYAGKVDRYSVPPGTNTDFASVPRAFVWFLPRYGSYTKAAILHDYLWRTRAATGAMDWVDADGVFRRAMRELNVPFLRRWIMWAAVRWAALSKTGGRKGWLRDGWRVLLVTVLSLPFVIPPALLIVISLAAFYLLELAVWVFISVGTAIRTAIRRRPPKKEINLPNFEWKTSQ
jgi:hypothetical protein